MSKLIHRLTPILIATGILVFLARLFAEKLIDSPYSGLIFYIQLLLLPFIAGFMAARGRDSRTIDSAIAGASISAAAIAATGFAFAIQVPDKFLLATLGYIISSIVVALIPQILFGLFGGWVENFCFPRATRSPNAPTVEQRLEIKIDNLENPAVIALLHEHLATLQLTSPPESRHALDLAGLRQPDIAFWSIWKDSQLAGFGALKHLDSSHAEIKSMRTATPFLRQGVASRMLKHLIEEGRARGYQRLSLETGSMAFFEPARRLYANFGFSTCPPFDSYIEDPNSVFMTLALNKEKPQ